MMSHLENAHIIMFLGHGGLGYQFSSFVPRKHFIRFSSFYIINWKRAPLQQIKLIAMNVIWSLPCSSHPGMWVVEWKYITKSWETFLRKFRSAKFFHSSGVLHKPSAIVIFNNENQIWKSERFISWPRFCCLA